MIHKGPWYRLETFFPYLEFSCKTLRTAYQNAAFACATILIITYKTKYRINDFIVFSRIFNNLKGQKKSVEQFDENKGSLVT